MDLLLGVHLWVERVRGPSGDADYPALPFDEPRWHARLLWTSQFKPDQVDLTDVRTLPRHLPLAPADAWRGMLVLPETHGIIFASHVSPRPGGLYTGRTDVLCLFTRVQ